MTSIFVHEGEEPCVGRDTTGDVDDEEQREQLQPWMAAERLLDPSIPLPGPEEMPELDDPAWVRQLLPWIAVPADVSVDWERARAEGRARGDGKGPWPRKAQDDARSPLMAFLAATLFSSDFRVLGPGAVREAVLAYLAVVRAAGRRYEPWNVKRSEKSSKRNSRHTRPDTSGSRPHSSTV